MWRSADSTVPSPASAGRRRSASSATLGLRRASARGRSHPTRRAGVRRAAWPAANAPQFEEVVVNAERGCFSTVPRVRSGSPQWRREGPRLPARIACRSGSGSALRSILPLGVSGSAGRTTQAVGAMYRAGSPGVRCAVDWEQRRSSVPRFNQRLRQSAMIDFAGRVDG